MSKKEKDIDGTADGMETAMKGFQMMASHEAEFEAVRHAISEEVAAVAKICKPDLNAEGQDEFVEDFWKVLKAFIESKSSESESVQEAAKKELQHMFKNVIRIEPFAQTVMTVYSRVRQNSMQMARVFEMARQGEAGNVPIETDAEKNAVDIWAGDGIDPREEKKES
jgi:hypothetical protein